MGISALVSCQPEEVLVERIVYDTIWVESPPIHIVETKTDTVWETVTVVDTVISSQHVVKTDTIFIAKQIQLVDTIYNEIIKTETVVEVDTVFVDRVEIVESRLRIVHPGVSNYSGVYQWNESISEWLLRVQAAGLKPKAETVIFLGVDNSLDPPKYTIELGADGFYYVHMTFIHSTAPIWQCLSHILLDIPIIPAPLEYESAYWWENEDEQILKPEYDHLMFEHFPILVYYVAAPEKKDWYWEDMFSSRPD
jgi:hypothetical protein